MKNAAPLADGTGVPSLHSQIVHAAPRDPTATIMYWLNYCNY